MYLRNIRFFVEERKLVKINQSMKYLDFLLNSVQKNQIFDAYEKFAQLMEVHFQNSLPLLRENFILGWAYCEKKRKAICSTVLL